MTAKPKQSLVTATLTGNVDDNDHHARTLINHLTLATRFTCVVAFARNSGFGMISDVVKERIAAGMSATFVVGVDFYQTEPALILDLMKLRKTAADPDDVKVYMGAENATCTMLRWPRDFGQGDKLFPLERETGRYGQGDTEALRG